MIKLNENNWADLSDIGQFSIEASNWNKYTDSEFELMGERIVNEQYNGNIGLAYTTIVK